MQAAEGKGPKQSKTANFYPLGQFKTVYGNDGTPGTVNVANPPYTAIVGTTNISGTQWNGGLTGSVVPGLNLNVNGNGATDVGFVCSPGPNTSLQDMETLYATVWLTTTFTGTVTLTLQGSNNRFQDATVYNSASWNNLVSITVTGTSTGQTFTINNTSSGVENPKMAYRLVASGATASGIIDWAIPGLFVDYYAMQVGSNSADANGNIGQMSIQGPRYLTISGGQVTSTTNGPVPYAANNNNRDYIGN